MINWVSDPTSALENLNALQDPVQKNFSSLRKHIKATSRLHDQYSKELDKVSVRLNDIICEKHRSSDISCD